MYGNILLRDPRGMHIAAFRSRQAEFNGQPWNARTDKMSCGVHGCEVHGWSLKIEKVTKCVWLSSEIWGKFGTRKKQSSPFLSDLSYGLAVQVLVSGGFVQPLISSAVQAPTNDMRPATQTRQRIPNMQAAVKSLGLRPGRKTAGGGGRQKK